MAFCKRTLSSVTAVNKVIVFTESNGTFKMGKKEKESLHRTPLQCLTTFNRWIQFVRIYCTWSYRLILILGMRERPIVSWNVSALWKGSLSVVLIPNTEIRNRGQRRRWLLSNLIHTLIESLVVMLAQHGPLKWLLITSWMYYWRHAVNVVSP